MIPTIPLLPYGVEVMSFERTMLIYKRGHSPKEAAGY
jgi:itaconyl-CoA hydratase